VLRVEQVAAGYGRSTVLRDVSLTVGRDELVSVIGANGAGKSTLLRAISGLIRPTSGRIVFEERVIEALPPHRIVRLGLVQVPEGRQLFPLLRVEENLDLGAFAHHRWGRHDDRDARKEAVFAMFPRLRDRRQQFAGSLSGGEQQMLAIARALMARPRLLILDEPSLGLAPLVVDELFRVIERLRDAGIPSLLVEQNARAAADLATRVYVMQQGRIVAEGRGDEILRDDALFRAYLGGAARSGEAGSG
jgi:branched-chain amino acid transport system ATP-binding protein